MGSDEQKRSMKYAREKLYIATSALAISDESLARRIKSAAITLHVLKANDFDPDLKASWEHIWGRMTSASARADEGNIVASISAMSEQELRQVAEDIHSLFYNVTKKCEHL